MLVMPGAKTMVSAPALPAAQPLTAALVLAAFTASWMVQEPGTLPLLALSTVMVLANAEVQKRTARISNEMARNDMFSTFVDEPRRRGLAQIAHTGVLRFKPRQGVALTAQSPSTRKNEIFRGSRT